MAVYYDSYIPVYRFMHYRTADGEYYMQTGTVSKELWQQFVALTLRDSKIIKTRPVCKVTKCFDVINTIS